MGAIQPPATGPLAGLLYESLFGWAAVHSFWSALSAAILVFFQAVLVNTLADEFRLMGDRNWFPGLLYALCASALPEFLFLSAPLVATTFIPISIWRIYNAYQKPNVAGAILDGAFWIGVASLFYPPALWLLAAAYGSYGIVRVFRLKERFVFVLGVFVPLFLTWLWYFWKDRGADFRDLQWGNLFQIYRFDAVLDSETLLKAALVAALGLLFLVGMGAIYSRKGIQTQKFYSVLYWFLAVGMLLGLLQAVWHWEQLLLPAASMGILLGLTFQNIKNRFYADLCHLGLLLFVFFIQFSDFFLFQINSML